eukprot:746714-Hanusia_phi.AAC.1
MEREGARVSGGGDGESGRGRGREGGGQREEWYGQMMGRGPDRLSQEPRLLERESHSDIAISCRHVAVPPEWSVQVESSWWHAKLEPSAGKGQGQEQGDRGGGSEFAVGQVAGLFPGVLADIDQDLNSLCVCFKLLSQLPPALTATPFLSFPASFISAIAPDRPSSVPDGTAGDWTLTNLLAWD